MALWNLGENFYLKPSKDSPVKLFLNDFDNNGEKEKIITRTIDGKDKPVFMKSELESQLPMLKKQNLRNADFAKKSVQELFNEAQMKNVQVSEVNYSSSCIAFNNGKGQFSISKLPAAVQLSSVKSVLPFDVNGDGLPDLVLGGNEFGFHPELGRLDAGTENLLINKGRGIFLPTGLQSGLELPGQLRDIVPLKRKNAPVILFLQNNEFPKLYGLKAITQGSTIIKKK